MRTFMCGSKGWMASVGRQRLVIYLLLLKVLTPFSGDIAVSKRTASPVHNLVECQLQFGIRSRRDGF